MVEAVASNQQQIENAVRDGIGGVRERIASECEKTNETTLVNESRDVKRVLDSGNETRLEAVVKEMKGEIRDEIRDVGRTIASGCEVEIRKMMDEMKNESDRVRAEMEDVKRLVLSRPTECECATVKPTDYSTLFNFSSIFPRGGSADPICPCARTPMASLEIIDGSGSNQGV